MKRFALSLAAVAAMAGAPALAQTDTKPRTAPGVQVDRLHDLQVGDRAPELHISEWIKGEPVTGFDKGQVYVVEFWATWCGPCIASMPHISKLQKQYADKGVRIIGVQIWEETDKARPFVETGRGSDRTDYTIATEEKIEGEDPRRNGMMVKHWMKPAGRNGIPSAFIVDQNGWIAWMGHPANMDKPLEEVVAGEWDLPEAAAMHVEKLRLGKTMDDFQAAARGGDADRAAELAGTLLASKAIMDDPGSLNMIAWLFVDPDGKMPGKHNDLAMKAAKRAVELTDHNDGMIMDTLAWAYFYAGDVDAAIKTELKAIDLVPDNAKPQFEETLERMKKMAKEGG